MIETNNTVASTEAGNSELLSKAGALQNAILINASFSMIVTDKQGIIQFFNAGAEKMLGYTAAEVVNKSSPSDMIDLDEMMARAVVLSLELATPIKPGFETLICKASRGIEDTFELTYICIGGDRFPALVSVSALRNELGEIIGYLLMGTNNAMRKRANMELMRVEQASLAKSEFLLQMSHELRTPLNVILGFAQLMESGYPPPPPSQKQNLDHIMLAGRYLLDLTNEILDLALIESGQATMSIEPVSLVEVLLECRAIYEPQARKRSIRMTFPQFANPCFVHADRTRLKQVLNNLLSNAIKYNRPGGTVTVECMLVDKVSDLAKNSIRINIRDTGLGLTLEQLAELFRPFNRLALEAGETAGVGIGLMVSRQLVELMGGAIGADSTVGVGSVLWVDLSTAAAPQLTFPEAWQSAPVRPLLADGAALRTVLYVEDNPANMELVKKLIARYPDLRLLCAEDGTLGIESARTNQPDVILMDINMPGISGIEAMKILREDPATAHIPIVALSANAMPHDIAKGLEAGFFNYLTKPIRVSQFMEILDGALHFSQTATDRAAKDTADQ